MPKGPKIAPAARREWLNAYEQGERIDKIARDARRTERTIKDHIERARQEREQREVHGGLLREAYQRHFEDLLRVARQIREAARTPSERGLLPSPDSRTRMLVEALRSHIPHSPLWGAWQKWEDQARRLNDVEVKTRARLGEVVDRVFAGTGKPFSRSGMVESLWFSIHHAATSESIDHMEYGIEHTGEGPNLRWGAFGLSGVADEAGLRVVQEEHGKLVRQVTCEEYVGALREELSRWAQARDAINEEVDILVLRHLVPGTCRLCPR